MFFCSPVTPSTELKLLPMWWWQRTGHQHRLAWTVWPAGCRSSSQPTCLYYIVLTKSLCLTIPLLYSNGETLLVYVFDICTNAPLWKRKWNLDISGINGQLVCLFEYHTHAQHKQFVSHHLLSLFCSDSFPSFIWLSYEGQPITAPSSVCCTAWHTATVEVQHAGGWKSNQNFLNKYIFSFLQ